MTKEIKQETTLSEILELPEGEEVLTKHGVPCMICPMMQVEAPQLSIGEVCNMYGIDQQNLLAELNQSQ